MTWAMVSNSYYSLDYGCLGLGLHAKRTPMKWESSLRTLLYCACGRVMPINTTQDC